MSFRIEEKFRFTKSDLILMKDLLYHQGLSCLYPSRLINSCYFDSDDFKSFHDSDDGSLPRKKIRYRWYNNEENIIKEVKVSSIEGRFKTSTKITDNNFLKDYKTKLYDKNYGLLNPSVLIKYSREYFSFKNLRITFDTNISYVDLRRLNRKTVYDPESVMEIKAPEYISHDYIKKFLSMPSSRFSKYCRAILLLQKML